MRSRPKMPTTSSVQSDSTPYLVMPEPKALRSAPKTFMIVRKSMKRQIPAMPGSICPTAGFCSPALFCSSVMARIGLLKGVQIGQQIVGLLLVESVAERGHETVAVHDGCGYALVVCG